MADNDLTTKYLAVVPHGWAISHSQNAAAVGAVELGRSGDLSLYRLRGTEEAVDAVHLHDFGYIRWTDAGPLRITLDAEGTIDHDTSLESDDASLSTFKVLIRELEEPRVVGEVAWHLPESTGPWSDVELRRRPVFAGDPVTPEDPTSAYFGKRGHVAFIDYAGTGEARHVIAHVRYPDGKRAVYGRHEIRHVADTPPSAQLVTGGAYYEPDQPDQPEEATA